MEIQKELDELKEEIQKAESDKSRSEGRLDGHYGRLKVLGIEESTSTLTKAKANERLEEIAERMTTLEAEVETDFTKLKGEYEW